MYSNAQNRRPFPPYPNPASQRPPQPYRGPINHRPPPFQQPYRNLNPPANQRPPQPSPSCLEPGKSTVYVSNLPYELTPDDIHQAFEEFGRILKVTILTVKETRKSKGVAFILFGRPEDARRCVEEANNSSIFGQTLKVCIARDNGRAPPAVKRPLPEERPPMMGILKKRFSE